ncbi:MAG: amidohydrolase family protein [Sumerlaeia bacterium]
MAIENDTTGYLNAHCHLELGHLRGAIPPGLDFVEWLDRIVDAKRKRPPAESERAAAFGLKRLRETGTTALLDIESMGTSEAARRADPIPGIIFRELIQFDPARADHHLSDVLVKRRAHGPLPRGLRFGLSPHAPYTTTEPLLLGALSTASMLREWICIHCAETAEETEMLLFGTGPLYEFLSDRNLLPPGWRPPGLSPVRYLATLGLLGARTLLVHCNDLSEMDIMVLRRSRCRVVLCPGTHIYFGREEFPLSRLLRAGVPVYLGTDSLASNEDLDMAREIRLAKQLAPDVDPAVIEGLARAERLRDFSSQ